MGYFKADGREGGSSEHPELPLDKPLPSNIKKRCVSPAGYLVLFRLYRPRWDITAYIIKFYAIYLGTEPVTHPTFNGIVHL